MSDFFQLFNPGARHVQQQRDLEKMLVVDYRKGGWGPKPLDLESGKVTIVMPNRLPETPDAEAEASEDPGSNAATAG
ncbi:DUF6191 domain-containing protein [Micropruina sp.]|uniref:DUF6191 domain-containing protein n=1 Tax=Micropruina sp. TaxID=2737536 RepID=UPI0026332491|nr:DUF6191 domain-containing protein [Micropruina sp.]